LAPQQFPDLSIAPDFTVRHENDSTLPAFKEFLRVAGEAEDLQYAVSSIGHGSRRANSSAENPTPIDCDDPPTAENKGNGDKRGKTDGRSSLCPYSDSSTTEEQGGEQGSLNTPPISVPGSEAG